MLSGRATVFVRRWHLPLIQWTLVTIIHVKCPVLIRKRAICNGAAVLWLSARTNNEKGGEFESYK